MAESGSRPASEEALSGADARELLVLVREMLEGLCEHGIEVSTETRSMAPLLEGAERIFWRTPEPPPRRGDVVIYYQRPRGGGEGLSGLIHRCLVVHRLIRCRREGGMRTKGDGRPQMDLGVLPTEAVLGVVTRILRADGSVSLEGAAARRYGLVIAALSGAGAGVYQLAAYADAVLRRLIPGLGRRRVLRAPAWWVQRLAIVGAHRLLAGRCLCQREGPA